MAAANESSEDDHVSKELLQSSFPLPPAIYYKNYTDANIKTGSVLPPPMVIEGNYSMFGDNFNTKEDIIRPLESQGLPRLYSKDENFDILAEMKKISHSILVNFLELMDILIDSPLQDERQKKLEDINVLFINLHHLINEFRPHQARETLRVMLFKQKAQRLETADKLYKHIEKTKTVLHGCHTNLLSRSTSKKSNQFEDVEMKEDTKPTEHNSNNIEKDIDSSVKLMCEVVDNIT
eukprot:gene9127-10100_t